ncbi:MAG: ubiquitin-like domain-containing protein [Culicoidibacterales bacterium]
MINGTSRSRTSSKSRNTMKKSKKNKFVTRLSQIMFVSFFGVAGFTGMNFKKTVNLQVDATQKQVSTAASTVRQLLTENNLDTSNYQVITNDDTVEANETIILSSKKEIKLSVEGNVRDVTTYALTFGDFLKEQNVELTPSHVVIEPQIHNKSDFLIQYKEIRIDDVTTEKREVTLKVDLPVEIVETDELLKGQEEVTPGSPKITVETYEIGKTNGVEMTNVKTSEVVTDAGKAAVKKVGKKVLQSGMGEDKKALMKAAGIQESDYEYVNYIIDRESKWNISATNSSSGAFGLPQSLPATKMASEGSDWKTNPVTQLKWANKYAKSRYGSWKHAYEYWNSNKVW